MNGYVGLPASEYDAPVEVLAVFVFGEAPAPESTPDDSDES